MLWHIVLAVALLLVPAFYLAPLLIEMLVRHTLPEGMRLHYFTPFEPLMVQLKLALYLALAGAGPVTMLEIAKFVGPALYEKERRWSFCMAFASLLLFAVWATFGYVLILPMVMTFSLTLAGPSLQPILGLSGFLELCGWLLFGFGVSFQLPLAVLTAVRLRLVRCRTLAKARPVIVVAILFVAAILTPPDVVSQLTLAIPCYILFELSLWLARRLEGPEIPDPPGEPPTLARENAPPEKSPELPDHPNADADADAMDPYLLARKPRRKIVFLGNRPKRRP